MVESFPHLAEQLLREQQLLRKADADIDEGRRRVNEQEDRLARLRIDGHDVRQANQLVELLRQTLSEWERHRVLIEQRVDYLQQQVTAHKE
ncbi:MAG: hypothetical protein KGK01_01535 [Bradyrhizobium sp.]|uniref:hypothetical protein n=1 Tax=Bradyrhizobium sp. TaxID=376 RepID=UPI001C28DDDF|nr:hypothetical protein [Bradyrhizobium sp.]MBU6461539.1 hypothetical protein [Pseudomonadota bacterium]MDE2066344.1 hypothetical protein [Bradyrhizobium sp.]MDE2241147.1 hypothetical protein [Bradyrhizobium sp.]MDE2471458.1 hypothetical protein [Bradyrhizobium sp.]